MLEGLGVTHRWLRVRRALTRWQVAASFASLVGTSLRLCLEFENKPVVWHRTHADSLIFSGAAETQGFDSLQEDARGLGS